MNLVILAISGLCIGAGVLMSEAFGAKAGRPLKRDVGNDAAVRRGALLCRRSAGLCADAVDPARAGRAGLDFGITGIYLRITFLGAPFTFSITRWRRA